LLAFRRHLERALGRILSNRLDGLVTAREISRRSYRKMVQNVSLAFLFNGIGVPLATTGLVYPVWAMVVMALSVTTIFFNSLWGQPSLFFSKRSLGPAKEQRPDWLGAAGRRKPTLRNVDVGVGWATYCPRVLFSGPAGQAHRGLLRSHRRGVTDWIEGLWERREARCLAASGARMAGPSRLAPLPQPLGQPRQTGQRP